ncbi:MAG: Gfo/Idh/MocA family oxidoreductase [Lentisphaeria bacterium]
MKQLRIGIIGLGNMGSAHYRTLQSIPEVKVTALCDIAPAALKKFPELPETAKFTDSESFLHQAEIDAVIIATPHFFHHTLGISALQHNKHLLVEKPIAVHKAHAQLLLNAIHDHPELKVSAMFNQRTIPLHRKLKELIEHGELGRIQRICWTITDWFRSQYYYDSGDWRATWRGEGGGVLTNQCPHQLDLLQWFFGMPERITAHAAFGKYHNIEVEDEVTAFLEYADGMTGVFIASTAEAPGSNRLEINADRGKVIFEKDSISFYRTVESVREYCRQSKQRFLPPECWNVEIPCSTDKAGQHRNILVNFVESVLKDVPLLAPAEEGIRGLEIGNAMLLSSWKKRTVSLPLDADEYESEINTRIASSCYQKETPTTKSDDSEFSKSF